MSQRYKRPSNEPDVGEDTPLLAPVVIADESGSGKAVKLNPPKKPVVADDEFVHLKDFFDVEKGWMKFWSPAMTFSQITSRDRDDTLFCFDAFRCFAFLWVSNSHIQEGMNTCD